MKVLGIHDGHNATACLLEDGEIVFCLQEERLTNIKNYAGAPIGAITEALKFGNVSMNELDGIGFSSRAMYGDIGYAHRVEQWRRHTFYSDLHPRPLVAKLRDKAEAYFGDTPRYRQLQRGKNLRRAGFLGELGLQDFDKVRFHDHHLTHAVSAYYASPWVNSPDPVLILTLDGAGDRLCATVSVGRNGRITRLAETPEENSLGKLYWAVTALLGFTPLEHEYKLMGMAPNASAARAERCYQVFKRYLQVDAEKLSFGPPVRAKGWLHLLNRMRRDLAYERFDNICHGLQRVTEELMTEWVSAAIHRTNLHRVALAGGVFMNVKANKCIAELPEVEELYILPSCGDESASMGAAYKSYVDVALARRQPVRLAPLSNIYLGPDITDEQVDAALADVRFACKVFEPDDLECEIARLLASGQVVARVSGRLEFGARALGNRSLLADPSRLECVNLINRMIKSRDFWMPFAPVVAEEDLQRYLVVRKGIYSPFMMLSHDSLPETRCEFQAALHQADHTARPQVLREADNPGYYKILKYFQELTGRGVLLNTSYNLHGYPLAAGAKEALWVMENSGLQFLALGRKLVQRV